MIRYADGGDKMALTIVDDSVAFIREHRSMYLPMDAPIDLSLARAVWCDALLLNSTEVLTTRSGEWWAVSSTTNWLHQEGVSTPDLFRRMIRLPEGGPNAIRSEVLLVAF